MVNVKNKGFGLLEVLVGLSILSVAFFSLYIVSQNILKLSRDVTSSLQADFLVEEGVEALRSVRDKGWTTNIASISTSITNYLIFATSTNKWSVTATPEIIDNQFWRNFTVANASRDSNDDIVESGGTTDTNTKKFTVSVNWKSITGTTTRTISTYLANYFND